MTINLSLLHAAAHFAGMGPRLRHAQHKGLEQAAKLVEAEAKHEIGDYQPAKGPFAAWQALATSTQEDRARKGFTPDDPLLRTGTLRDSIKHNVQMSGMSSGIARVGSDSMIAVYQELGTSRIPPRSFLGGAAFSKSRQVRDILGDAVHAVIAGKTAI